MAEGYLLSFDFRSEARERDMIAQWVGKTMRVFLT
jgi:hypothetical protein